MYAGANPRESRSSFVNLDGKAGPLQQPGRRQPTETGTNYRYVGSALHGNAPTGGMLRVTALVAATGNIYLEL